MSHHKVTMSLTDNDVKNTVIMEGRLKAKNKASAVSGSLAIAERLTRVIEEGSELIVRQKNGTDEKVIIHGLVPRTSR